MARRAKLTWKGRQQAERVRRAAAAEVGEAADTFVDLLQNDLSRSGVSAPGEPPGRGTGVYRASIHADKRGLTKKNPTASVTSSSSLADEFEFGTNKMAPRPHFRPRLRRSAKALIRAFAAGMRRRLKR